MRCDPCEVLLPLQVEARRVAAAPPPTPRERGESGRSGASRLWQFELRQRHQLPRMLVGGLNRGDRRGAGDAKQILARGLVADSGEEVDGSDRRARAHIAEPERLAIGNQGEVLSLRSQDLL